MFVNRRDFVALSSLGFVGALGNRSLFAQARGGAPAAAPTVPEFKDVRRNVGTFTARGGTIGYLVTADAVVVIDSQFADTAPLFLEGMKPKTTRKIDFLINSHHHPDHTGGNKVMQPNVAKIVAHANVPGLQRKQAATQKSEDNQAYADTTFDKDWKASVGKETVSARYYGPAHTGGDQAQQQARDGRFQTPGPCSTLHQKKCGSEDERVGPRLGLSHSPVGLLEVKGGVPPGRSEAERDHNRRPPQRSSGRPGEPCRHREP